MYCACLRQQCPEARSPLPYPMRVAQESKVTRASRVQHSACNPRCPAKILYCISKISVRRIALKFSNAIRTICLKPFILLGAAALFLALAAAAQDMPGPMTTAPKPKPAPASPPSSDPAQEPPPPQRLHSPGDNPITNDPPSQPVAEIIKRFAARETEFRIERDNYTYTQ